MHLLRFVRLLVFRRRGYVRLPCSSLQLHRYLLRGISKWKFQLSIRTHRVCHLCLSFNVQSFINLERFTTMTSADACRFSFRCQPDWLTLRQVSSPGQAGFFPPIYPSHLPAYPLATSDFRLVWILIQVCRPYMGASNGVEGCVPRARSLPPAPSDFISQ